MGEGEDKEKGNGMGRAGIVLLSLSQVRVRWIREGKSGGWDEIVDLGKGERG